MVRHTWTRAKIICRIGGNATAATTATANSRVVADVAEQLAGVDPGEPGGESRDEVVTIRGALARVSLRLGVLRLPDAKTRLAWLLTHLGDLPGSGIIYVLTVSAAEDTARLLREAGQEVHAYTGRTDTSEREVLEQRLNARATDSKSSISSRVYKANFELAFEDRFDVTVVNDVLDEACEHAERLVRNFISGEPSIV